MEDMALGCIGRRLGSEFSGVEENNFLVGELICDLVVNHIIHNERGLSENPRLLLVKGTWVEGKTTPRRKRDKKRSTSVRKLPSNHKFNE